MGTYMSQQHYQSLLNTTITQEENNATTAASAAVVTTRSNRFAQQASALARLKRRLITAKRRCQATKAVGKEQQHHSAATPPPYAAAVVEPNNDSVTDDANMLMKLQAITAKCQLYATISKPDYIREHEKQTKRIRRRDDQSFSTRRWRVAGTRGRQRGGHAQGRPGAAPARAPSAERACRDGRCHDCGRTQGRHHPLPSVGPE